MSFSLAVLLVSQYCPGASILWLCVGSDADSIMVYVCVGVEWGMRMREGEGGMEERDRRGVEKKYG